MTTTRRTFSLEEKAEVIARHQLGQTSRYVAAETGIGFESVKTILKRYRSGRLSKDEEAAVEAAETAIKASLAGNISNLVESGIIETLSVQQQIREQALELLNVMAKQTPEDLYEVGAVARTLATISVATKTTGDFARALAKEVRTGDGVIEGFIIEDLTNSDVEKLTVQQLIAERLETSKDAEK